MSRKFTTEERAKLTCSVLDRVFASYGKWNGLARAAQGRSTHGPNLYRLPESVRETLNANNWESGICIALAEHYLPSLAPLSPDHASGALRIVQQDYYGWSRDAILREPEGPAHIALVQALEQLELEINFDETGAG
jgi:hypothetical protein